MLSGIREAGPTLRAALSHHRRAPRIPSESILRSAHYFAEATGGRTAHSLNIWIITRPEMYPPRESSSTAGIHGRIPTGAGSTSTLPPLFLRRADAGPGPGARHRHLEVPARRSFERKPDAPPSRQVTRRGRFDPSFSLYSTEDLRRAQDAFKEYRLQIHQESPRGSRRFLVFVQASRAVARDFLSGERDFDILLNFYDGPPVADWPGVEHLVSQRGTKSTAIAKLLEARPDLLLRYDAVLFLDDDIVLSSPALSRFFAEMDRFGLDLAQPSLTAESSCVWPVLKQPAVGPGMRLVNAVEIMMPAATRLPLNEPGGFSARQSVATAWTFSLAMRSSISWVARPVSSARWSRCTRSNRQSQGSFYAFMRSLGIKPKHELWTIMKEFGIEAAFEYRD